MSINTSHLDLTEDRARGLLDRDALLQAGRDARERISNKHRSG